jgi:di/tricarboxylate transporter
MNLQWQAWTTLGVVALLFCVLAFTSIGADLVLLAGLTVLMTVGVVEPAAALEGFANEATITVAALFVIAAGIRETGVMAVLTHRLLGRPKTVLGAQARMTGVLASVSAFICNTPLTAMTLPAVDDWAKRNKISPSKVMIPLSYSIILGGLGTLMGTSTNLLINGLVVSQSHLPALRLFDVTWVGVPCALVGLSYILVFNRWLLPERKPVLADAADAKRYMVEMVVQSGSSLIGRSIEDAGLRHLPGLYLVEIDRGGQVLPAVSPQECLQAEDRLVFVGIVESVVDLQKIRGLRPANKQVFRLDVPRPARWFIEAVVSESCPLVGQTIREGRFRTVYNAAVLAVARHGKRLEKKIGDIVLQAGDVLLLEAGPGFVDQQRNSRDFLLISRLENASVPRYDRAWIAVTILLSLVVVVGLGWLKTVTASLLAAGLMVLTSCCTGPIARQSLNLRVLLVIAASFGIGRAMQISGAAEAISNALLGAAGPHPWLALAVVYGLTMVFSEVMSHNAAVVVIFPIALLTANALGVSFMPFVMAITVAASCSFATPTGYPTNLMVYGPGGYHFVDYFRFGGPLDLLMWAVAVGLIPFIWPF